jgi:hypothetical protein
MTRPTVQGGGSGGSGGGGTTFDPAWIPLYDADFSALADEDVKPDSDGNIVIDGKTWYARNVSKMDTLDVGPTAGGFKIGLSPAAAGSSWFNGTRTAPSLELEISEVLAGTDYESRADVELRIRAELAFPTPLASAVDEVISIGLETKTYDAAQRYQIYQGSAFGSATYRRVITNFSGTLRRGDVDLLNTDLAYFPNVLGISILENYVKSEYSENASSEVSDDLKTAATLATTPAIVASDPSDLKRHFFFFSYAKISGTSLATYLTLKRLRIEARFSPRGIGVFVP